MPIVTCLLEKCLHNADGVCNYEGVIVLEDEHMCIGGCDDGWVFPPEDEEE